MRIPNQSTGVNRVAGTVLARHAGILPLEFLTASAVVPAQRMGTPPVYERTPTSGVVFARKGYGYFCGVSFGIGTGACYRCELWEWNGSCTNPLDISTCTGSWSQTGEGVSSGCAGVLGRG